MKKEQYIQVDLNGETLNAFITDPAPNIGGMIRVFLLEECKEISILPKRIITSPLIKDGDALVSAKGRFGHEIPVYDDGYGPLFIHRDSMGITGIVRAQTWEDAYSICEDEFFPSGDDDAEEAYKEIEALPEDSKERQHLEACFDESYGYRGNTRKMEDGSLSSVYAKDLNGDSLDLLTRDLCAQLEITLEIEIEEETAA
jgi:hypothetical protein